MSFLKDIKRYDNAMLPGVRLPSIKIESKHYKELNLDSSVDNFNFLKVLCYSKLTTTKYQSKEYQNRLTMELDIFKELEFVDYVLLNWDILNFCHENQIPTGPGRGSAAGSLVLFLIGVTKVDPIKYGLFFERFVSRSRAKKIIKDDITYLEGSLLPDVDNDISYDRRSEVIEYIERKHHGKTAKILTLNTLSSKLCIKEWGKIVGEYSESEVNEVSDCIPKIFGRVMPLVDSYKENEKFKEWVDLNKKTFAIGRKIESLNKNTGVHPSGIAISYYDIQEICPLQKTSEGDFVTGYDMNYVSELMVKFDVLGLRTLTVVDRVCKSLGIEMDSIDVSDENIYKNFKDLKTPQGLFQIEADTNYRVCKKVKPRGLEELSAVVALARPGALDFTDEYALYTSSGQFGLVHDFFKEELSYTAGIPLYQEQLMKMVVKIGFTLDEAEQLRRIVGKKKVDQMPVWKEKISEKIAENNLEPQIGEVLWKVAEDSANYSFNKSHSISYATLSAWTAYLKFNYPQDFYLALLELSKYEPDSHAEISRISQELVYFDMKLLSPDLSKSALDFSKEGNNIRFGLNAIKGVSEKSLQALESFRGSNKANKFETFLAAKEAKINIGLLSALIQAGTLESSENRSRSGLVMEAQVFNILTDKEKAYALSVAEKYNFDILQIVFQAAFNPEKPDAKRGDGKPFMTEKRKITFKRKYNEYKKIYSQNKGNEDFANWYFENKLLGYNPSVKLKSVFKESQNNFTDCLQLHSAFNGDSVKIVAIVEDVYKSKSRKSNSTFYKFQVSDESGRTSALFMDSPRVKRLTNYIEKGNKIPQKEDIIVFTGKKGDDIVWVDNINILENKIYMKLSDVQ